MISFKGFDQKILTFKVASAINAGTPVKISANSTVGQRLNISAFCDMRMAPMWCGIISRQKSASMSPEAGALLICVSMVLYILS